MATPTFGERCVLGHAIEIEGVSVRLDGVSILENVTVSVPMGKLSVLIGPNGAGKTTLLMAMLGLVPYSGRIRFCGCGPHGSGVPRVGYVPQRLDFDRAAPISVLDFLCISRRCRPLFLGCSGPVADSARAALERVGMARLAGRFLGRLSGGELQRVLLAQVLQDDPHVILLDEPVSGVDAAGEQLFLELVREITGSGERTVLMVSHDISVVAERAEHVIALNRTVTSQGTPAEVLSTENLLRLFGVRLHFVGARDHLERCPPSGPPAPPAPPAPEAHHHHHDGDCPGGGGEPEP